MTAPVQPQPDYFEKARQLRAAGASIDEIQQYLASKGVHPQGEIPAVKPDVTSALPRNRENPSGDYEVLGKGLAANVLNAAQGIPGMERFEAGMGALGSRIPGNGPPLSYQESLAALRSQTSKIPAAISIPEKVLGGGGVVARAIGPIASIGKAAATGAGLGAADQAASADSMSLGQRALRAGIGAGVGGGVGAVAGAAPSIINKGRELVGLAKRVNAAPTAGAEAVAMKNATSDMDALNYGRAEAQGAAHETSPALQTALEHPRIKPYADMVRSSEQFAGANDATVAREADKLMTEDRLGFQQQAEKIADNGGSAAELRMKVNNLMGAQQRLRQATAETSFKPPIHLDVAGENTTVEPKVIVPEREPQTGPILPGTAGRARGDQAQVSVGPSGQATAVSPRDVQGPMGPAFSLRANPGHAIPGVEIQTPAMRIETAPPQRVPPVMAAYPKAVATHAANAQDAEQFQRGYDEATAIMSGKVNRLKGENLATQSQEAIAQRISTMPPDEAENYLRGVLSAAKPGPMKLPGKNATAFGSLSHAVAGRAIKLNALSPFVNSLDVQAGRQPFQPTDFSQTISRILGGANAGFTNGSQP